MGDVVRLVVDLVVLLLDLPSDQAESIGVEVET